MGDIRWEWENGLTDKHPIQWLHDMQTRSDKLVDKKKKIIELVDMKFINYYGLLQLVMI